MTPTEKVIINKVILFLIFNKKSSHSVFEKMLPEARKVHHVLIFFELGDSCSFRCDFRIYISKYGVYEEKCCTQNNCTFNFLQKKN